MPQQITSRDNPKIKYACKLQQSAAFREKEGLFFAEGPKLCLELAKGCHNKVIYYTDAALAAWPALAEMEGEQYLIPLPVAEKLAGVPSPQGVFGVFALPRAGLDDLTAGGHYLCMEAVQDPGNVGTLIRSAAAFGFDAVVCSAGCASPFGPKAVRASMGAVGRIPVIQAGDMSAALGQLRRKGVYTVAAALQRSRPLSQVTGPFPGGVAVVIGNEGQGLTEAAIDACDVCARIPMSDKVESLNAAAAGAVLAWHFRGKVD